MFRIGTLTARLVAVAVVWIAAALIVGGFLLAGLFHAHVQRSFDRQLGNLLVSLITEAATEGVDKTVGPPDPLFEQVYSGRYWQISNGDKVLRASPSLFEKTLPPKAVAATPDRDGIPIRRYQIAFPLKTANQTLRVIERDITLEQGGPVLRFTVAGDLAEVEDQFQPFLVTLIWSLSALGLGLVAAVLIQVYIGLKPLDRVRDALGKVRAGQAERLEGDFPSEVRPLVEEVNQLISHIGEVVERARTHVGNLAHALKTPLSVLANEAARTGGPLAEAVTRETEAMQERIGHHLARARTAATGGVLGQRAELAPVLDGLRRALVKMYADKALSIEVAGAGADPGLAFSGDSHDLEEMLGNLMENACKWAAARVRVTSEAQAGGRLSVTVEDDGPGLRPEQRDVVLTRGERLDESVPGSGLGLAIVSEIAGLYGGRLTLGDAPLGGLSATLDLPRAVAG